MTFEKFKTEFDRILMERAGINWADACGDDEPLQAYFGSFTPEEAVEDYMERYELIDIRAVRYGW